MLLNRFRIYKKMVMKMISYSFNVKKLIKNEALFVQSLNEYFQYKKTSLSG